MMLLLLVVACSESPPSEVAEQPSPSRLEGAYRFAQVNGQSPPLEWPAGSGAMLESGTLVIDTTGRFSMQFIVGGPLGSEPSGQQGAYSVSADTIYFTPDGSTESPAWFQFELADGGTLRLRDTEQNLWSYARRQGAD